MTKLSRALSSCAPYWTIQGRHEDTGKWHDLYQYQDTVQGALKAKAALNQIIMSDDDPPGLSHYDDFRLLDPVPTKVRKKARRIARERAVEAREVALTEAVAEARKRHHSRSGGRPSKGRKSKKGKAKAKA